MKISDAKAGTNAVEENTSSDFTLSQENIESLTIIKPDGWQATVSGNTLTVTAPGLKNPYAEQTGTIVLIGLSASGQAATASMTVGAAVPVDGAFLNALVQDSWRVNSEFDGGGEDIELDKDGDGFILLSDAARVKAIYAFGIGLSSLSGLEYFPALECLDCEDNNLTGTLDLSSYVNLRELYCSETDISALDLSGCVNLEALYCNDTKLEKLDLSGYGKLQLLECNDNPNLSELDLSGCGKLQALYCNYNDDLSELDVSGCVNLQKLLCFNNPNLSTLDVSGCVNLQELYCHYNDNLSELKVSGCGNLQTLNCSYTNLDKLDVSGCANLQTLSCNYNDILSELKVSGCGNLQTLNCSYTNLDKLDVLNCVNLQSLNCSHTKLNTLDVSNCVNLQSLFCYNSSLTDDLDVSTCSETLFLNSTGNLGLTKIWRSAAQATAAGSWITQGVPVVQVP